MVGWIVDLDAVFAEPVSERTAEHLLDALEAVGGKAPSVAGGIGSEMGATFGVRAPRGSSVAEVVLLGVDLFSQACEKIGSFEATPVRVTAETEAHYEDELERRRDEWTLVGLAEIASTLGVSKQRVGELRRRSDFPRPVAELASGPVWKLSMLKRFVAGWERKPGRPRRISRAS